MCDYVTSGPRFIFADFKIEAIESSPIVCVMTFTLSRAICTEAGWCQVRKIFYLAAAT